MGTVHRAYDTVNRRVVALKRLPGTGVDAEFVARFRREARVAAGLRHPHVVPVHAFGEIDGQLYLDMALIDGTDLRRLLGSEVARPATRARRARPDRRRAGRGPRRRAGPPRRQAVQHPDRPRRPRLPGRLRHRPLDVLGIDRPDPLRGLLGTLDYLAPERLSGGAVDGRADQYSLACVLFECLTGRLPHPADGTGRQARRRTCCGRRPPRRCSIRRSRPPLDAVRAAGHGQGARRGGSRPCGRPARGGATRRSTADDGGRHAGDRDRDRAGSGLPDRGDRPGHGGRRPPAPAGRSACPYPGLRGFEAADARWFHGRDQVVTDLLVRLTEQLDGGEPVVLVGASGSGKSSVLRAGLLPALAAGARRAAAWPQVVCTPGRGSGRRAGGGARPGPSASTSGRWRARSATRRPEFGRWCRDRGGAGW